ncbi:discoidin domain-containing protein [Actinosynnema sp. NPDC020468]|uniref:discoidin domain-containing protein n=1 Tax=Actinosynnema sp. NPDC020468 TaxID=3154488 RepID=UPI0033EF4007
MTLSTRRPLRLLSALLASVALAVVAPAADAAPAAPVNYALTGVADASSTFPGYSAAKVNDGDASTTLGGNYSWCNNALVDYPPINPQWVHIDLKQVRKASRIVVVTTEGYVLRDFDVQVQIPGRGWFETVQTFNYNTATSVTVTGPPTDIIGVRVLAKVGPSHQPGHTRVNEIQVFDV